MLDTIHKELEGKILRKIDQQTLSVITLQVDTVDNAYVYVSFENESLSHVTGKIHKHSFHYKGADIVTFDLDHFKFSFKE